MNVVQSVDIMIPWFPKGPVRLAQLCRGVVLSLLTLVLIGTSFVGCARPNTSPPLPPPPFPHDPDRRDAVLYFDQHIAELDRRLSAVPHHVPTLKRRISLRLQHQREPWLAVKDAKKLVELEPECPVAADHHAEALLADWLIQPALAEIDRALSLVSKGSSADSSSEHLKESLVTKKTLVRAILGEVAAPDSPMGTTQAHINAIHLQGSVLDNRLAYAYRTWEEGLGPTIKTSTSPVISDTVLRNAHASFISAIDQGLFTPQSSAPSSIETFPSNPVVLRELRRAYHEARFRYFTLIGQGLAPLERFLDSPEVIDERSRRATQWVNVGDNKWFVYSAGGPDVMQILQLLTYIGVSNGEPSDDPSMPTKPKGILIKDNLPTSDDAILHWLGGRRGDIVTSINGIAVTKLFDAIKVVGDELTTNPNAMFRRFVAEAFRGGQMFKIEIVVFDPEVPTP